MDAEEIAKVHSILGAQQPHQGMTQTIPELMILCFTCGWMRASEYPPHLTELLAPLVEQAKREAWSEGVLHLASRHAISVGPGWLRATNPYRAERAARTPQDEGRGGEG